MLNIQTANNIHVKKGTSMIKYRDWDMVGLCQKKTSIMIKYRLGKSLHKNNV